MPRPRPPKKKSVKKTMFIFCEGEKTEPNYLQQYIDSAADSTSTHVVEISKTRKNTPKQLVDEACKLIKSDRFLGDDEVWVVYDRESPKKYAEDLHAKSHKKALDNSISIAISNVCFEIWILLHFCYSATPYENYEDLRKKSPLETQFQNHTGQEYGKSILDLYSLLSGLTSTARQNAKRLRATQELSAAQGKDKPYHLNPYTDIDLLLDNIDSFSEDKA